MADLTQFLLLTAIVALTVTLVVVGYQVYLTIRQLRATLVKVDRVLSNVVEVTDDVARPIHMVSSLASGLDFLTKMAEFFRKGAKEEKVEMHPVAKEEVLPVEDTTHQSFPEEFVPSHISKVQSQGRRFFFRRKNV